MGDYVMALDQGTTSSRAILFDRGGQIVSTAQREFEQILPKPGEVEHDPEAIWSSQLAVVRQAMQQAAVDATSLKAIGITNQRETVVVWDRETGRPIHNAIVWQSRVTTKICERLKSQGCEDLFRAKTGLLIDPYFSGTKITHLLEIYPEVRERAGRGEVLFGTVDSFLIWRLTGGRKHVTDVSNASRTLLFNLHTLDWDDELLEVLRIPRAMLPEIVPSSHVIAETDEALLGARVPIAGVAGDQQAATFGQACFQPGDAKNTYGTGCFLLLNTGERPVMSQNNLLTTVGWSLQGKVTYCLEGSLFIGGAVVQWLRDSLKIIDSSEQIEQLAATVPDNGGVVFVPAFVGLGAPHWDPYARGAILGLTRGSQAGHVARAALEAMALQTRDLLAAMRADFGSSLSALNVDGGASVNNELMQFQADILDIPVRRPVVAETTALGAAYLAGLAVGYWENMDDVTRNWSLEREFTPAMDDDRRQQFVNRWEKAVDRVRGWEDREA
jgi:glycerol kinase